jgi:hypothetical protein
VYTGSTATLYANGRNIGSAARASWTTGTQANFYIGRRWDAVGSISFFNGYISNFRVVIGRAIYTSAFTPPTSPLVAVSGTQLLLNTSYDSNYLLDSGPNNITYSGNTVSSPLNPFN